jgi:hypothetical protein
MNNWHTGTLRAGHMGGSAGNMSEWLDGTCGWQGIYINIYISQMLKCLRRNVVGWHAGTLRAGHMGGPAGNMSEWLECTCGWLGIYISGLSVTLAGNMSECSNL